MFKSIYFSVDPLAQVESWGISGTEQAPCALLGPPIRNLTVAKIILSPLPCTLVSANIPSITIAAPRRVMGEKIGSDDNGEWRIYLKASHNRTFFFLFKQSES